MERSVKQPGQSSLSGWGEFIGVGAAIGLGELAGVSIRVGESLYADTQQHVSWNPLIMAINLGTGDLDWTGAATGGAVTLAVGTGAAVAGSVWAWKATCRKCVQLRKGSGSRRARIKREKVDKQAKWMAKGSELADLRRDAVLAKAQDLAVQLKDGDAPGVLIGRTVIDGQELYGSYEDLHVDIWGPRAGKSTSRVIPAVMEAPGAVVATSNKRDVVDATRGPRSRTGEVFVFDPQGVAAEPCTWYWNPLEWVLGEDGGAGAQKRAASLAGHFAVAGEASQKDAFFDPEGEDLLAGLFLACALDKKPITQAFMWVTTAHDKTPVQILRAHGYGEAASSLTAQYVAPDKQRAGVFGTAKKMANCLKYLNIHPWVCPPVKGEAARTSFKVEEFVRRGHDTLYPLSKKEKGSAAPLVTAMCAAVNDAAADVATHHRRGRLPVPLLLVLDEAANIVKWADLPEQYSHFGSRGIVVMTILQSWAQGVNCWGHDGMTMLWGASNVKVLGGGVDDEAFLRARSELIGHHYELATSTSKSHNQTGPGSMSVSTSRTTEITLHASDLAALPKGRMVVFTSGHRATLCQAVPWMVRPYAAEVSAAITEAEQAQITAGNPIGRSHLHAVPSVDEEGQSA